MEISNNTFSAVIRKYENEVKTEETEQIQEDLPETSQAMKEFAQQQCLQAQETANSNGDCFVRSDGNVGTISNINIHVDEPENVEASGDVSAAKIASETIQKATQAPNYSAEELEYIKKLVYNSHHSFIANFRDADTFFEYVNTKKDSSITKDTGITRSQLISLTQNDKWEDNHQDFFGSLNRSFYSLDENSDGKLSYDEVKTFLNTYLKKDGYNDFKNKVQEYSDEIQKKFDNASNNPKAKIQLIIDYTRDYLDAAGLTNQLNSLDRLLKEDDLFADANHHIGNISFSNLNEKKDGEEESKPDDVTAEGGYASWSGYFDYTNENTNKKPSGTSTSFTQEVRIFCHETDFEDNNLGLSFDISLLNAGNSWEYLVSVLVHELTHATVAEFSTVYDTDYGVMAITEENLSALQRMGVFSSDEYETVKEHLKDINAQYGKYVRSGDNKWLGGKNLEIVPAEDGKVNISYDSKLSDEDGAFLDKLLYKIDAARGEYMAYQADADYLDSIGGDIFTNSKTAVDGDKEQDTIINWIDYSGYNDEHNQPLPDWKWWSYA